MGKKKRYEVKVDLGKDVHGNRVRKSIYSSKSMKDARRKAEEYRVKYEMENFLGESGPVKKVKFQVWAKQALELYKRPFVKANTYAGTYLEPLERHLIPYFGNLNMDEIRPIHIQTYINEASQKYAPETVKKDWNVLRLLFNTAVDNQLCAKSPLAATIQLPAYHTTVSKQAYTQEQYDKAFRFASEYPGGLSLMLLLETGISRSELLGLRWSDVNWEEKSVSINQGLVIYHSEEQGKQVTENSGLKNKFRRRTIPITNDTLWRMICQAPKTVRIRGQNIQTEYVIHSPEGGAYQPNNWQNRVFRPFMRALHEKFPDVPILTPHELRHTRATLWIGAGMEPYMAARLLGHSDLKMLTRIYDHTSPETLRKTLEKIQPKEDEPGETPDTGDSE